MDHCRRNRQVVKLNIFLGTQEDTGHINKLSDKRRVYLDDTESKVENAVFEPIYLDAIVCQVSQLVFNEGLKCLYCFFFFKLKCTQVP